MFKQRLTVTFTVIVLCWFFLFVRLFGWQVEAGHDLAARAEAQRRIGLPVQPARGRILDRLGGDLSFGCPAWALVAFPGGIEDHEGFARDLEASLGFRDEPVLGREVTPFVLRRGLSQEVASRLAARWPRGLVSIGLPLRYGKDSMARHIVGYMTEDGRGAAGLEARFDEILRSEDVFTLEAQVDANMGLIPGLGYRLKEPSSQPRDIILTIDADIQRVVESVMERRVPKGAVVVLDPATGEVLAMASRPQFDQARVGEYLKKRDAPLINRAVSRFPPGSVFKVIVAAAALEEGLGSRLHECEGEIEVDGLTFACYMKGEGGHGVLSLQEALAESCNIAFIKVASLLGPERLCDYAGRFGLGSLSNLGLDQEMSALLPHLEDLGPRGLANFSIGQGNLLVTPLDMARVMATIANDGVLVEPSLVKEVRARDGTSLYSAGPPKGKRVVSVETARALQEALMVATLSGTGQRAFVEGPGSGGKTGTAETGGREGEEKTLAHAWFVGYSPAEKADYVVAVLVEDGMSGPVVAAPIFREIVEGLFILKSPSGVL